MYIRWFIGLVLLCLSLVAQGRAYTYEAINEQSGACIEYSLKLKISQVAFDLGKYTNLKKAYTGFQSQLGSGYTTFENALRKCNNDVLTAFDNNTALFNKLGNIKDLGETELAERMAKVTKGEDFGVLKVGNNLVGVNGGGNWVSKLKNKSLLSALEADINANSAFKNLLEADNNLLEAWEILAGTPYRTGEKYLNYVSKLSKEAKLGNVTSFDYRTTFFNEFPELTKTDYVVHHAIEQQVLKDYPGLFTDAELHSLENLRGIPKTINSDVHLSKIRIEWNKFYKAYPNATKQQFLEKAKEIDDLFGNQLYPPIR